MDDRKTLVRELDQLELGIRELEITYEQYFAGVEKREPAPAREKFAKLLRRFANRRIVQTDLRYRYQNLATRFHSYQGYWDRILRLMDEGRYVRHLHKGRPPLPPAPGKPVTEPTLAKPSGEADRLFEQLVSAHQLCRIDSPAPDRQQVSTFLERQKEKIRERFGDREVEFLVVTEEGKPKIKVRPK